MRRSAPGDGYDFGNKRQYRRTVWKTLADTCPVPRAEARVALMPSSEGDEIDVALSKGFREQNLVVIDRNPAIVAHLKRRYPKITTVGLELERIGERLPAKSIHVANFDLCGQVSSTPTLNAITAGAVVLAEDSVVAVTVLRGREQNWPVIQSVAADILERSTSPLDESTWNDLRESDKARSTGVMMAILDGVDVPCVLIRHFTYKSAGPSTMLCSIFWCFPPKMAHPDPKSLNPTQEEVKAVLHRFKVMGKYCAFAESEETV